MATSIITDRDIERRRFWISEIVRISGAFGDDARRVESELVAELESEGPEALLGHLRLCSAMPESYRHDSSEEKLYSKYSDAVLALSFRQLGMQSAVLTERANAADVEVTASRFSFVADAKTFRLSRTAKNQKDFKIQAMNGWKYGKPYAMVVAPVYQVPIRTSQIYQQSTSLNVAIITFPHIALLVTLSLESGRQVAVDALMRIFEAVETALPSSDATSYWTIVNRSFLEITPRASAFWLNEKTASLDSLAALKREGLAFLASQREAILKMTHEEALHFLMVERNIHGRQKVIEAIRGNELLSLS